MNIRMLQSKKVMKECQFWEVFGQSSILF